MLGPLSTYASSMRQRQWVHPSDHVLHRDRGSVALGGRWDVARAVPEPTSQTEPCACSDAGRARAAAFCADIALNDDIRLVSALGIGDGTPRRYAASLTCAVLALAGALSETQTDSPLWICNAERGR